MNLNQELRTQLGLRKRSDSPAKQMKPVIMETEETTETKYYDKEFRKFHVKVAVIISVLVAGTLALIFNLPGLIDRFYPSIKN